MGFLPNTVINFHAVYDSEWMESTLLLLKKLYNIISIQDLEKFYYQGLKLRNACHITFDDGDSSFYETVFPLLQKHKIPVSIYVSPLIAEKKGNFWFQEIRDYEKNILGNIIGERINSKPANNSSIHLMAMLKSMKLADIWETIKEYQKRTNTQLKPNVNMDKTQLQELHKSGLVAIGAHTLNHPILKNESDEVAFKEIKFSVEGLSELLGGKVKYFAYPNGTPDLDFSEREQEWLKSLDIKLAFSTENRSFNRKDNPLAIPRNGISRGSHNFIKMKLLAGRKWTVMKRLLNGKQEDNYRRNYSSSKH